MARAINIARGTTKSRLKQPLNPSVRGTVEQSRHEHKGLDRPSFHHEGSGQRRGGGRGGRMSGHKR